MNILAFFKTFAFGPVQTFVHLVDIEKCCKMNTNVQNRLCYNSKQSPRTTCNLYTYDCSSPDSEVIHHIYWSLIARRSTLNLQDMRSRECGSRRIPISQKSGAEIMRVNLNATLLHHFDSFCFHSILRTGKNESTSR